MLQGLLDSIHFYGSFIFLVSLCINFLYGLIEQKGIVFYHDFASFLIIVPKFGNYFNVHTSYRERQKENQLLYYRNKDKNVHRFALRAIRVNFGERKRKREKDPHNLEREASMDHPIGEGLG